MVLMALFPLGETLARNGKGLQAWKVACQTDTVLILTGAEHLQVRNQAIKGIALRALGELEDAERELRKVRREFAEQGRELLAALASLDLACVYAAQCRFEEVKQLAGEAYSVFSRQGVQKEALRALSTLEQAAQAERLTEKLAVEVANFVVRSQQNHSLRFSLAPA
jgi:tetratricopeptide (TPR) repeat protein